MQKILMSLSDEHIEVLDTVKDIMNVKHRVDVIRLLLDLLGSPENLNEAKNLALLKITDKRAGMLWFSESDNDYVKTFSTMGAYTKEFSVNKGIHDTTVEVTFRD